MTPPPPPAYASVAELKARLGLTATDHDAELGELLDAASRAIDDYCHRHFYATAAETRYYTAQETGVLWTDDLLAIDTDGLATDDDADGTHETLWQPADFLLADYNAPLSSQPAPYARVEVAPWGARRFPVGVARGVRLTGTFGFASAVPAVVHEACLFQALLAYQAWLSPTGATGSAEFDAELGGRGAAAAGAMGLHPFTRRLLDPYRLLEVA